MDHWNTTVKNGTLVSTRRGLVVSKSKHKGTAFVNSFAQNYKPSSTKDTNDSPPISGKFTFVIQGEVSKSKRSARTPEPREKPRKPRQKKQTQDETRLHPLTPASSGSPCSSSWVSVASEPPSLCDVSEETCAPPPRAKSLPAWASYKLEEGISDSRQRLLFMTFGLGPAPDHDDVQENVTNTCQKKASAWCGQDPTSLHCAVTLGVLFDAVQSGKPNSPALGKLASQLCAIIKRRLNDKMQSQMSHEVTIRAIATMAIISGYQGKPDHWCVHMRGLMNLIDIAGGQHKLDADTISIIRRADVTGAVWAATNPCVPFIKRCSGEPSLKAPDDSVRAITRHLNSCHLDPEVVDAIVGVAAIGLTRNHYGRSSDTRPCIESADEFYYDLIYRLLLKPEPLRSFDDIISPLTSNNLSLQAQDFPTPESANTAMDNYTKALESAMRILALLYIREPTLDLPCADRVLLDLLAQHVGTILADRQVVMSDDPFSNSRLPLQMSSSQRPCLIWICIAGHIFTSSKIKLSQGHDGQGVSATFAELLSNVIGPEASLNPDLVPDEDLELCHSLDLRYIEGEQWNEKIGMRQMLGEMKAEYSNVMPPPSRETSHESSFVRRQDTSGWPDYTGH